jgi:hypothetical protein
MDRLGKTHAAKVTLYESSCADADDNDRGEVVLRDFSSLLASCSWDYGRIWSWSAGISMPLLSLAGSSYFFLDVCNIYGNH